MKDIVLVFSLWMDIKNELDKRFSDSFGYTEGGISVEQIISES